MQRLLRHDSALGMLYSKRQVGHLYRSLRYPFGRPTVLREQQALNAFAALGLRVPRLIYCAAQRDAGQWRALLITEALQGFISLDQWYQDDCRQQWGEAVHRRMLGNVAATLARFHRARWQHGCCYPSTCSSRYTRIKTAESKWLCSIWKKAAADSARRMPQGTTCVSSTAIETACRMRTGVAFRRRTGNALPI